MELVGLALEEAVVPVEAALAGPLVVGPGGRGVLHRAEVPLAEREGGVALVAEAPLPSVAARWVTEPRMWGKPVLKFEIDRIPTVWWFRPVSSAARVGEHRGVTWKFV